MSRKNSAQDWQDYYQRTDDRPPRETLMEALSRFDKEEAVGRAVDLGCGNGRDTIEILRRGWSVLAIDAQASAIETLKKRLELDELKTTLVTKVSRFENAVWSGADLVNSSFALPLCRKTDFLDIWQRIYDSLRSGGRFSGQLYGDRDEWAGNPTNTHFTPAEVQTLIGHYDVEKFWEEETDSVTPRGTLKHWHIYHIVARKP